MYTFLYLHSHLMYFYQCYNNKDFRQKARLNFFSFRPISKKDLIEIFSSSATIIDIQHPNQIGLTMRTFEVMGLGKKLITTNQDIMNYDFYQPENVYVIDRNEPYVDAQFLKTPFKEVPVETKYKYSIENWLKSILQ
jgi:hypothetical protein